MCNEERKKEKRPLSAVAGKIFGKKSGSQLGGLGVINEEGTTEWVSSDPDLRKVINSNVQQTSKGRNAGDLGQSIVVSCWMEILADTTTLWNDVVVRTLVKSDREAGKRWRTLKSKLVTLQRDLGRWKKKDKENTDRGDAVSGSAGGGRPEKSIEDHQANTEDLKERCLESGFTRPQTGQTGWLLENLKELKILLPFVEANFKFLYDGMSSRSPNAATATAKWREIEKGPKTIEEIAKTAAGMTNGKSHIGLSPEHVCSSKATQEALLFLSRFYFAGDPPKEMKTGLVTSIYKDSFRFRPITSLDISFQLCESYHKKKEMELIVDCGINRQFGGVIGRSASEPLIELELLLNDAILNDKTLIAYFTDKTSAYDATNPSLFPMMYARWGCPLHISARMAGVTWHHYRVCKTSMGTANLDDAVGLEAGVPQGGILSAIRFICMADALMYCEINAKCTGYTINDPESGEEVLYMLRYFMDDAVGLSGPPKPSKEYPAITTGMQAAALAGSFLSISNNAKKTAVLTTDPENFPKNLSLIHLSGERLTSDVITIKENQRDLRKIQDFTATTVEGFRERKAHALDDKFLSNWQRSASAAKPCTEVIKIGMQQTVLGTVQNSFRPEIPLHRDVHERMDVKLAATALKLLDIKFEGDKTALTTLLSLPRAMGGLGYPLPGIIAAKTAGIEPIAILEGRNDKLKSALKLGISQQTHGIAARIKSSLSNAKVEIHKSKPGLGVPTANGVLCNCPSDAACRLAMTKTRHGLHSGLQTEKKQDEVCSVIMKECGITEGEMIDAAACTLVFPNMLLRVCRTEEVIFEDEMVSGVKIKPKDAKAKASVEDTVLHGSRDVESQYTSFTRSVESVLRLCTHQAIEDNSRNMIIAIVDDRKCTIEHDLSHEAGRTKAGLQKNSPADKLSAKYKEVLISNREVNSKEDHGVLNFFNLRDVLGDCDLSTLSLSNNKRVLQQLTSEALGKLAAQLEVSKNKLRADPQWNPDHKNRIVMVSDASAPQDSERDHSMTNACHREYIKRKSEGDALKATSKLAEAERTNLKKQICDDLASAKARSVVAVVFVHWDHDDIDQNDDQTGWHLTGMFKSGKNTVQLCSLTSKKDGIDGNMSINRATRGFKQGTSPLMYAHKNHKIVHNIWATQTRQTLMWEPAFVDGGLWNCPINTNTDNILACRPVILLKEPLSVHNMIFDMFDEMYDDFHGMHPAKWNRFASEPTIQRLMQIQCKGIFQADDNVRRHANRSDDEEEEATDTRDVDKSYTYAECIRYGFWPSIRYQARLLAQSWNAWQGDTIRKTCLQHEPTCECLTQKTRSADDSECSIKRVKPVDCNNTLNSPTVESLDTEEDIDFDALIDTTLDDILEDEETGDMWGKEQFTCTCGARFSSATNLEVHRLTTSDRSTLHQRCASEMPVAGGAFFIIDMKTMRPISAEMVDCTNAGCTPSCSTQAEIQTAVQGMRRLLTLDLRDKKVETYCDNAALLQRTLSIADQYLTRRKVIKMSHLGVSKAFSDAKKVLSSRCKHLTTHWRGAEHNLAYYADREIEDLGNLLSDHYADIAAVKSAEQVAVVPRRFEQQEQTSGGTEIHISGSESSTPIATIMEKSVHAEGLEAMQHIPHANCDRNKPQRHQLCAHAAAENFDVKTLHIALKMTCTAACESFDRHALDCTNLDDKLLCAKLPQQAQPAAIKMLDGLRGADKHDKASEPACILCGERYGEGKQLGRLARHYAYECKSFQDQRHHLNMSTTSIVYHTGRSFHNDLHQRIGFRMKDAASPELYDEDPPTDKYGRLCVTVEKQSHSFDVETVQTNWQNLCILTRQDGKPTKQVAKLVGPCAMCKSKEAVITCKTCETEHYCSKECLEAAWLYKKHNKLCNGVKSTTTATIFLKDLIEIGAATLRASYKVRSAQPHPAVLKWFTETYSLEEQHECTPFNCTSGIFRTSPRACQDLPHKDDRKLDSIGMRQPVNTAIPLTKSCFTSIQTCSTDWQKRLEHLGTSVSKDKELTIVCMITFNGNGGPHECKSLYKDKHGVEILHCPEQSLTVVGPNGFAENGDPYQKRRVDGDFKQVGHKAEALKLNKMSYRLKDHSLIEGPTAGGAGNTVRHQFSACQFEVIFVVFKQGLTAESAYKHASKRLTALCKIFAATNPSKGSPWTQLQIEWRAHQQVELSITNMLHGTPTARGCLRRFRDATRHKIDDGVYFANRIKLGFTSRMSIEFLEMLGARTADAREAASRIAKLEMEFLLDIETTGRCKILQKLISLGCPITPDGQLSNTIVACEECSVAVGKTFVVDIGDDSVNEMTHRVCSTCASIKTKETIVPRVFRHRRAQHDRFSQKTGQTKSRDAQATTLHTLSRSMSKSDPTVTHFGFEDDPSDSDSDARCTITPIQRTLSSEKKKGKAKSLLLTRHDSRRLILTPEKAEGPTRSKSSRAITSLAGTPQEGGTDITMTSTATIITTDRKRKRDEPKSRQGKQRRRQMKWQRTPKENGKR